MVDKYNTVALIAVKGDSERIKKKNIRKFADTNLLELKIKQLIKSNAVDKIIVSSESNEVLEIAASFNEIYLHKRDPSYSSNNISMSKVYSYLANQINCNHIMWCPVTNPLAGPEVYKKAMKLYEKKDLIYDCLLSCIKVNDYLLRNFKPINFTRNPWMKSQDLKDITALSFAVNILKRESMIEWGSLVGHNPLFMELEKEESIDIDFINDFEFAEFIFKKNPEKYY